MVETPVLFITFARPDYARQTWEGIKAAKPKTLYFYSNKGREEIIGEIERNDEIRSYINEIDWECDLHTFFRNECVNIYESLRGAIDWLFDNEETGIILEEDCVPTLGFFSYVDQMIEKFRDDKRVWFISGDNYINCNPNNEDYIFSRMCQIYGWACWRDRWKSIEWNVSFANIICKKSFLRYLYPTRKMQKDRMWIIKQQYDFLQKSKCWDGIFYLNMERNGALCVYPKELLISNVGLSGTHNKQKKPKPWNNCATYFLSEYVISKEPTVIMPNMKFDMAMFNITWRRPPLIIYQLMRIRSLIKRIIK